jgi:tetratricopeptide (TPR) repeat protein
MADESILDRERRALHTRTVALLDKERDLKAAPEMLAHHQTEAGLYGDAIASWIEAGRKAADQSAHHEAIDYLRRGLSLLDQVPDEALRRALELKGLSVMIGPVTITEGATSFELSAICARGLELSRDFPTPTAFPFVFGQFTFANCRGRTADARASADMFLSLSEQMHYDAGRVIGHRLKGMLALGDGHLADARAHLERSICLYEAERDSGSTSTFGQHAHLHSLALLSLALFCLGDAREALDVGREALLALDTLSHPHSTAIVLSYVGGNVFGFCGATEHLLREARKLVAVSDQHDLPGFRPHALAFLGWGLAQRGEFEEGIVLMNSAIRAFDAMEYTLGVCAHLGNLGEALRLVGRLDEAKAASARAIEMAQASGGAWSESEIFRIDALIEADRWPDGRQLAAQRLWTAAERARAIGAPVFERRCLVSLVEVGGDPNILHKAEARLRALAHLDHLPELVEAVMADARVPV